MTRRVTDEQFGHYSRRVHDLNERILKESVPFESTMNALQALIENNGSRLVDLVGPIYPMGTIALSLEIDRSLSLEEMIRRGKYANEEWALREITEDHFPINRNVPELRYSTTVLLIPPYREGISFKDQEAVMAMNRLQQLGIVETLAIGDQEQYPHLQLAYYIIGSGSTWLSSDGDLSSPALWQGGGERGLGLDWRAPEGRLGEDGRCIASPQADA